MVLRINKTDDNYKEIISYGFENRSALDKLAAFLFAISPILQHFVGVYENAGVTALIITFPIILVRFISKITSGKINAKCFYAILPLIIFELYSVVVRSFTISRWAYGLFMLFMLFSIACGCINMTYLLKYATMVCCLSTTLLLIQYVSYYLIGLVINFELTDFVLDQESRWVLYATETGFTNISGMYRPSAFFLEPSHLFLYNFPILVVFLLSPRINPWRFQMAVIVTIGLVLSTSGMGIAVSIGVWGVYFLLYRGGSAGGNFKRLLSKFFSPERVLLILTIVMVLVFAYLFIPVLQDSVNRIFSGTDGWSAIDGRTRLALRYIKRISGSAIIFGKANVVSEIEFNLAGFFATYIKWGVIGLFFTYWFYGQGLFKLKHAYFWITIIILVTSFFSAHTHGTFYMMYYVSFLMSGYHLTSRIKDRKINDNL